MHSNSIRNPNGIWINTNVFREEAIFFQRNGFYNSDPVGSPDWFTYWKEQRKRCIEGYTVGGVKITGYHYFYLNFCPIMKMDENGKKLTNYKTRDFPNFWDGDYEYFWCREIARSGTVKSQVNNYTEYESYLELSEIEQHKKDIEYLDRLKLVSKVKHSNLKGNLNMIVGKARRRGFSYKNASVGACNYFHFPGRITLYAAYEKNFLYPDATTIFPMTMFYINFINEFTAWTMPSDVINKVAAGHIRASYKEVVNGVELEKGFKSEIRAISCKDNPDALRGKDAYDEFFEESGAFGPPGLLKATISAAEDTTKQGIYRTGMITVFGCVCKDTKVWNHKGQLVNIQDITKESGIIGYASKGVINENISWLKPPAKKDCVRITTEKGYQIECSKDHPLLWTSTDYISYTKNKKVKNATFKEAQNIKVGDSLLQTLQVPVFGNKKLLTPRLIGLLIGDGYYGGEHSSSQLAVSEKEILDYLDDNNIKYSTYFKKSCDKPFFRYITLKHTQEQLRLLGLQGQSKQLKRLPSNIWDFDKESVGELLGGYFDADGYINTQGKRKRITLTSVVKELLEEVKVQLHKFSIQSHIYTRKHNSVILKSNVNKKEYNINTKISYSLEICDKESFRNFKKHIGFIIKKKQEVLDSWNLEKSSTEKILEYNYYHTIEKGDYFIENNKLENLVNRKVIKVEDIGEQDIYNLTADFTHTYITNGFISHNTSGDLKSGTADYADMINNPERFDFLAFDNIFEDKATSSIGFFSPANWNFTGFMDEQGNSDKDSARNLVIKLREDKKAKGATAKQLNQMEQENPLSPSEAFGSTGSNIFPIQELKAQRDIVKNRGLNDLRGQNGKLSLDPSLGVIFNVDLKKNLTRIDSMTVNEDEIGCLTVYERPIENAPKGLYKIGYDPVRQDSGTSLVSYVVYKSNMKGVSNFYNDNIVAIYIGRNETNDDNHRIGELLAMWYNTQVMYENEVPDVKTYFQRRKLLSLLALQPDGVISKAVKKSTVSRIYGCHMTTQLRDAGEKYIKDWLLQICEYDEEGKPVMRLNKIYNLRLLDELIGYDRLQATRYDVISALIMAIFQVQEEYIDKEFEDKSDKNKGKRLLKAYKSLLGG